jgi:hypothetical protein
MTPEELASIHPHLFHITASSWLSIKKHGLLSSSALLDLFEIKEPERTCIEKRPRPSGIVLQHPQHGSVVLNDNVPLKESALEKCLEDGLTIADWMCILNKRVFFWSNEENLQKHLNARLNRGKSLEILVIDTLSLAKEYGEQIELCPINSGVTFRKAAKRGLTTFTPMLKHPYKTWKKLRGKQDKIQEVTVLYHVKNIEHHVKEIIGQRT